MTKTNATKTVEIDMLRGGFCILEFIIFMARLYLGVF